MMETNFMLFNTPANQPGVSSYREHRKQFFEQEEQNILFRYKLERKPPLANKQLPSHNEISKPIQRPVSSCRATLQHTKIWINIPGVGFVKSQPDQKGKKFTSITPRKDPSELSQNVGTTHRALPLGRAERIAVGKFEPFSAREKGSSNQFSHLKALIKKLTSERTSPRAPNEDDTQVSQTHHNFKNPLLLNRRNRIKDYETITPKSHRPTSKNYLHEDKSSQIKTPEFRTFLANTSLIEEISKEKQINSNRTTPRAGFSNQEQLQGKTINHNSRKYKSLNSSMEDTDSYGIQRDSNLKEEQGEGYSKEFERGNFQQLDLNFEQQRLAMYLNKPSTAKNSRLGRSNGFYNYKSAEERIAEVNERQIGDNIDYSLNRINPPNENELGFLEKAFKFYNKKFHDSQKAKKYLKGSIALREELHSIIDAETEKFKQKIVEVSSVRRPISRQPFPK